MQFERQRRGAGFTRGAAQVTALKETFGAEPRALEDVLLLAPADKLEERQREYPGVEVRPLKFGAAELRTSRWRFLMGAAGNQATYIRQLNRVMKPLRDDLTLDGLNQEIEASSLPDHRKGMAKMRLELASEYIDDSARLKDEIRPGRMSIVSTLTPEKRANLRPGEAIIWSSKATDESFTKGAVKIRCRPRVTHHGGATKTAVGS
ncbi:hypothetical protein ACMHYB_09665 [Sorangium sp. So ce1128]